MSRFTKAFRVTVRGLSPLVMDNSKTGPLLATRINKLRYQNRSPQEEDEYQRILYQAALFGLVDNKPGINSFVLLSPFVFFSRKQEEQTRLKKALRVEGTAELQYEGPKSLAELCYHDDFVYFIFRHDSGEEVGIPIFPNWGVTFDLRFDPQMIAPSAVLTILKRGEKEGYGSLRNKGFGQFEITKAELIDVVDTTVEDAPIEFLPGVFEPVAATPQVSPTATTTVEEEPTTETATTETPTKGLNRITDATLGTLQKLVDDPNFKSGIGFLHETLAITLNKNNSCTSRGLDWTPSRLRDAIRHYRERAAA